MTGEKRDDYAEVNGLKMYYEVHGDGRPLVLLHGAYMIVDDMGPLLAALAEGRRVIAVELQGHGRTADVDRPITYEGMADDVAALMGHLGIGEADVFGYSMGAGVALQLAIRHPASVGRLVAVSVSYTSDGMQPELHEMAPSITPEMFAGTPFEAAYKEVAPNPEDFPTLVEKLKTLDTTPYDWGAENVRGIGSPTMIVVGDADAVRVEHAVEMFRLLGAPARGAPRHHALYPAGQRGPRPRRMAAGDGHPVSRRARARGGGVVVTDQGRISWARCYWI